MFIREVVKQNKGYKQKFIYHSLMESYRTDYGPRQRTILALGRLNIPREKYKALANRIEELVNGQMPIFPIDNEIEPLAHHYSKMLIGKSIKEDGEEIIKDEADYEEVDVNTVVNQESRTIGGEHVSASMLKKLDIESILDEIGLTEKESKIAQSLIIGRMISPGSELHTHSWIKEFSAIGELLNMDISRMSHNQLYNCSDALIKHKKEIEDGLAGKERSLFELEEKIILYDLTNTYFEGGIGSSKKKRYGRSKEKRGDCPLVTLGLVLDEKGFPKRSEIFSGNVSEGKTLLAMVKGLNGDSARKKTVIIDAGIATKENIKLLKEEGYDYICVSRDKPFDEIPEDNFIILRHNRENKVEARLFRNGEEVILFCRSLKKKMKEESMRTKFSERFEIDLKNITESLHKKGGRKQYAKVLERIGRLKEKHKRVSHFYDIKVEKKENLAVNITWNLKNESNIDERFSGTYYLRSSRTDLTEKQIWEFYILLTDVEDSFRSMKSELGLRPNCHQKDPRIDGHAFITVLAYHVVNSIQWYLHRKDIYMSWSTIRRFLSKQIRVTTQMIARDGKVISIRNTSNPEPFNIMIANALDITPMPLNKKKWKTKTS